MHSPQLHMTFIASQTGQTGRGSVLSLSQKVCTTGNSFHNSRDMFKPNVPIHTTEPVPVCTAASLLTPEPHNAAVCAHIYLAPRGFTA